MGVTALRGAWGKVVFHGTVHQLAMRTILHSENILLPGTGPLFIAQYGYLQFEGCCTAQATVARFDADATPWL